MQELDGDVQKLRFTLEVNGQTRQTGDTRQMLFTVDRIIAAVSRYMTLRMGDLIYTGTPAGVGPVSPGDNLRQEALTGRTGFANAAKGGREAIRQKPHITLNNKTLKTRPCC